MQLKPTTPGIPTSTVHIVGFTQARYCVSSYAPTSRVSVAEPGGDTSTIRTNNLGAGCTQLAVRSGCGSDAANGIVATGIGADGNPATSVAALPQATATTTCSPTTSTEHSSAGGVDLSLHGVGLLLLVAAAVLAAAVVAGGIAYRRRSSSG